MTIIETLVNDLNELTSDVAALRSGHDGLASSISAVGKGHRELIDDLSKKVDSRAADSAAMYETAEANLIETRKALEAFATGFSARIGAVESRFEQQKKKYADEARNLQMLLDGANERTALILEAKDMWMDRALKAEAGVSTKERERCARIVEEAELPYFRSATREVLVKMIREAK